MNDEQKIEAEIQAKGLTAPRLTRASTGNVTVSLNGQGFVITREEILDNVDEAVLISRYRGLKSVA